MYLLMAILTCCCFHRGHAAYGSAVNIVNNGTNSTTVGGKFQDTSSNEAKLNAQTVHRTGGIKAYLGR